VSNDCHTKAIIKNACEFSLSDPLSRQHLHEEAYQLSVDKIRQFESCEPCSHVCTYRRNEIIGLQNYACQYTLIHYLQCAIKSFVLRCARTLDAAAVKRASYDHDICRHEISTLQFPLWSSKIYCRISKWLSLAWSRLISELDSLCRACWRSTASVGRGVNPLVSKVSWHPQLLANGVLGDGRGGWMEEKENSWTPPDPEIDSRLWVLVCMSMEY